MRQLDWSHEQNTEALTMKIENLEEEEEEEDQKSEIQSDNKDVSKPVHKYRTTQQIHL